MLSARESGSFYAAGSFGCFQQGHGKVLLCALSLNWVWRSARGRSGVTPLSLLLLHRENQREDKARSMVSWVKAPFAQGGRGLIALSGFFFSHLFASCGSLRLAHPVEHGWAPFFRPSGPLQGMELWHGEWARKRWNEDGKNTIGPESGIEAPFLAFILRP